MGRGNWIPDTPIYEGEYDLVYVELQDVCRESSPDTMKSNGSTETLRPTSGPFCPNRSAKSSGAKA